MVCLLWVGLASSTCHLPSAVLGCRILGNPACTAPQQSESSLGVHFLVNLTCPGQGREARYPLALPVGRRLNQNLPPALGSPSPLESSLPPFHGMLAGVSVSLCSPFPNCWSLL